ncbi:hypothetical protein AB0K16_48760 [Nonomuraea jabiensis]|uniref:hypothetical protein n=1 Tax=Nonomuraea jabiensis TaxID=882448 RepID=UPI0034161576
MSARDTGVAPARAVYAAGRMAGAQLDAQGVDAAWPQVHRWAAHAQAARTPERGADARVPVVCVAVGGAAGRVLAVRSADGGVAA